MEKTHSLRRFLVIRAEIFGFVFLVALLVGLCAGCGDGTGGTTGGDAQVGLAPTTSSVSSGSDITNVGNVPTGSSAVLPSTGTCKIPSAAEAWIPLPSPMTYQVAGGITLWCTQGLPAVGRLNNIDFSQDPLKGLDCLSLVSDVPAAKAALNGIDSTQWGCCQMTRSDPSGYVQPEGVLCAPASQLQVSALCSVSGTFMGWACSVNQPGAMGILPMKKTAS